MLLVPLVMIFTKKKSNIQQKCKKVGVILKNFLTLEFNAIAYFLRYFQKVKTYVKRIIKGTISVLGFCQI